MNYLRAGGLLCLLLVAMAAVLPMGALAQDDAPDGLVPPGAETSIGDGAEKATAEEAPAEGVTPPEESEEAPAEEVTPPEESEEAPAEEVTSPEVVEDAPMMDAPMEDAPMDDTASTETAVSEGTTSAATGNETAGVTNETTPEEEVETAPEEEEEEEEEKRSLKRSSPRQIESGAREKIRQTTPGTPRHSRASSTISMTTWEPKPSQST